MARRGELRLGSVRLGRQGEARPVTVGSSGLGTVYHGSLGGLCHVRSRTVTLGLVGRVPAGKVCRGLEGPGESSHGESWQARRVLEWRAEFSYGGACFGRQIV